MSTMTAQSVKKEVTLYHNPNCSKSRGTLELLTEHTERHKLSLKVIEYLSAPLDRATLTELIELLPIEPADLVRKDKNFKALNLDPNDYQTAEQVIAVLTDHPELMQRPVATCNGKAAIGRPPETVLELFS